MSKKVTHYVDMCLRVPEELQISVFLKILTQSKLLLNNYLMQFNERTKAESPPLLLPDFWQRKYSQFVL